MRTKGITLIGMSGSGKSTVGAVLAEKLNMPMIDVDRWIEQHENGMPLAEVIETKGANYELELELRCIHEHDLTTMIVSSPGSIIYTDTYDVLKSQTHIVWLDVPVEVLRERIESDPERQRLILGLKEKGIDVLLNERLPLYKQWAEYTVNCADKSIEEVSDEIIATLT